MRVSPTGHAPAAYPARLSIAPARARARAVVPSRDGCECVRGGPLPGPLLLPSRPRSHGAVARRACPRAGRASAAKSAFAKRSSLVDPASSHMLVSKIKPCMSQCMPN